MRERVRWFLAGCRVGEWGEARHLGRFQSMEDRFDAINKRFDDMRDLWRAELRRVEEVLDARLKQLEERG